MPHSVCVSRSSTLDKRGHTVHLAPLPPQPVGSNLYFDSSFRRSAYGIASVFKHQLKRVTAVPAPRITIFSFAPAPPSTTREPARAAYRQDSSHIKSPRLNGRLQHTLHSRAGRNRIRLRLHRCQLSRHSTRIELVLPFTLVESRLVHLANAYLHILPNDRHFTASTSPVSPIARYRSPHHPILIHIFLLQVHNRIILIHTRPQIPERLHS